MSLHESRQKSDSLLDLGDSDCPESLASALTRNNYTVKRFNDKIDQVDTDALSPFPPRGLGKAASFQYRLWRETGERKWLDDSDAIMLMISHFSKRWMNAGKGSSRIEHKGNI